MKCVIVGGVAGGATTAARLRRNLETADIVIFERGEHISYANCGLPYYIGGIIPEREKLFLQNPDNFLKNFNIKVHVLSEVVAINRSEKTVTVKDRKTGEEFREHYDKLVLSPGAEPVKPPIPGINEPGIFTLRNVPDTDSIKQFIETKKPKRAVIVGAGFIGLEMAENLHHQGIFVTIVEMAEQVMNVVDYEMAAEVHQHLKTKGVEFYLKDAVSSFLRSNEKLTLTLKSGKRIDADMVILSIGVRPDSALAKQAGIEIGKTGGIKVNEYLQTSDPNIYAVGDAIEFQNPITGKPSITYLAGPANKQGRIAADNIAFGNKSAYKGAIGTAVAKVFDLTVATTGISEKTLDAEGIPYQEIITHSSSHAGYYPDAKGMSIKTHFDPVSGKLLGAQIVGFEGVDKRIDMFAAVLRNNSTVRDLTDIEHAYAPPYSSAKDPVNIAGFVAENILSGKSRHIQWHKMLQMDRETLFLLDVRTPEEFALGTIEGAVNIPMYELRKRLSEVPKNKTVIVFCGVGFRAYVCERILKQNGFTDVYNLSGGYKTYQSATQKQSNEDIFEKDFIGKDNVIYQANVEARDEQGRIKTVKVDACGMQCPGPIMRLKQEIEKLQPGERLLETATDPGFARDVRSWCNMTGNRLVDLEESAGTIKALIEKQEKKTSQTQAKAGEEATLIVFSDDLDRALASFVIANGAVSAGKKVTMFFTFWGLSILKKEKLPKTKKDFMGSLFGMMLPKNSTGLSLSKMNFAGIGRNMMRRRMEAKNVDSLESMILSAKQYGVRLVACQMSMDIMGVKKEELIDGVEIGGVATYLEAASTSQVNLFV